MTIFNGITCNNFYCEKMPLNSVNVDFMNFKPLLPRFDFQKFNFSGINLNFNLNPFNYRNLNFDVFDTVFSAPKYDVFSFKVPPMQNFYSNNQQQFYKFPQMIFSPTVEHNPLLRVGDTFIESELPKAKLKPLSLRLVNKAKSYDGRVNSDKEGNRLFSPGGKSQAWCADFVTFVVKDVYGNSIPSSFGSSAVSGIRDWGKQNDCYLELPKNGEAKYIAQNIKPGDIMILKDNGRSHTGIVSKVNSDGSFEAVEGNCSNKVKTIKYSATNPEISGFVTLQKYA